MASYLELEKLRKEHIGEVCIFGAGTIGRCEGYDLIKAVGFRVDFYCDNHVAVGTVICDGIEVKDLQYLYENKENMLVFVCLSFKYQREVLEQLESHGITNIVVVDSSYISQVMESIEVADETVKQKYNDCYDDKEYLKRKFKRIMGYDLNLDTPTTFNEKLQWLKLYDQNPLYTKMVDKYEMKEYVKQVLGDGYTVPTLGIYESVSGIEWEKLPNQFVLKCTHDSGSTVICSDKKNFDKNAASEKLENRLKYNFYWGLREWPYKNVKPRIIAEAYLQDEYGELRDYKFFTFAGKVKALFVATEREKENVETKFDFFDRDYNHLEFTNGHPCADTPPQKPRNYEKMIEISEKLSEGIPHVRVDFYEVHGQVYVGEITFSHWGGMMPFKPSVWDKVFGSYINLRF